MIVRFKHPNAIDTNIVYLLIAIIDSRILIYSS